MGGKRKSEPPSLRLCYKKSAENAQLARVSADFVDYLK